MLVLAYYGYLAQKKTLENLVIKKVVGKVVIRLTFMFVLVAIIALVFFAFFRSDSFNLNEKKISPTIIETKFEINEWSHWLIYYDEVLTHSARNYASTNDLKWKNRYDQTLKDLYKLIALILSKSQSKDLKLFKEFDKVNSELAIMEKSSFEAINRKDNQLAISILDSKKYDFYKVKYKSLIQKYLDLKTLNYKISFNKFTKNTLDVINFNKERTALISNTFFTIVILFIFFTALLIWFVIKRIKKITMFVDQIIVGEDFSEIETRKNNELDDYVGSLIHTLKNTRLASDKHFSDALSIQIETLRNEFKRNLHDRLGVLVSATKLHFYFLKPEKAELIKHYTTCLKLMDQTFNEIKLLSNSDVSNKHDSKLIDSLRAIISFFKSLQQIEIQLDFRMDEVILSPFEKESIELILREAINNVINHAKASNISIQITQMESEIYISICDNGIGFLPEKLTRKNGLNHMKQRVDSLGGNFELTSHIGIGTEIKITFKLHEHAKKN